MDKKTKMFRLAKEWKESGLSRASFSQQHGITFRSLEYWCRKLKKEGCNLGVDNNLDNKLSSEPSFIEIVNNSSSGSTNRPVQIELELPGGLRVKIY